MKPIIALLTLIMLSGCAPAFQGDLLRPDGSVFWHVEKNTMPFISRKSSFEATHEWLGEDNVLHTATLREFSDERADAQSELMKNLLATMAAMAAGGGGVK